MFETYFWLGFRHILDFKGYDHILFIVVLCAPYQLKHWKQILILITAFTVGHSLTLALAAFDLIRVNSSLVELLIAITIALTALQNIFTGKPDRTANRMKYIFALFFGLIHGLGFSGYLKALLGKEDNVILPLFSFNVGIEAGQLVVVAIMFLFFLIAEKAIKVKPREWNLVFSGMALGISLVLLLERF